MYSFNGRRYDKIETNTFWSRLKSNIVKRWRVIIVPFQKFFIPGGLQDEREDIPEEPEAAEPEIEETFAQPETTHAPEPAPVEEEEPEIDTSGMSQADLDLANEIFARLQAEAAADDAAKAAEIEEAKRMADAASAAPEEVHNSASYNATTNSFSGDYGTGPVDEETADIVAELLKQNNRSTIDF